MTHLLQLFLNFFVFRTNLIKLSKIVIEVTKHNLFRYVTNLNTLSIDNNVLIILVYVSSVTRNFQRGVLDPPPPKKKKKKKIFSSFYVTNIRLIFKLKLSSFIFAYTISRKRGVFEPPSTSPGYAIGICTRTIYLFASVIAKIQSSASIFKLKDLCRNSQNFLSKILKIFLNFKLLLQTS